MLYKFQGASHHMSFLETSILYFCPCSFMIEKLFCSGNDSFWLTETLKLGFEEWIWILAWGFNLYFELFAQNHQFKIPFPEKTMNFFTRISDFLPLKINII